MVNLFKYHSFNSLGSGLLLFVFTTTVIHCPHLNASEININTAEINFNIKIEKMFERMKDSVEKGEVNNIIEQMFDIKEEIEQYTGQIFDINKFIEEAIQKASENGINIEKKYIEEIKNFFDLKDRKYKHRFSWYTQCAKLGITYSNFDADFYFDSNCELSRSERHRRRDEDVPIPTLVGVTMSLCGLFLMFIPTPITMKCGNWILNTGIGILTGDFLTQSENERLKNKEKRND